MIEGIKVKLKDTIWSIKIPLKIKLFIWLLFNDKILTRDNLAKRGWMGNDRCVFFSSQETVIHLLFKCSYTEEF